MKRLLCLILTAATLICLLPGCAERVSVSSFSVIRFSRSASLPMSPTNSRVVSKSMSYCKMESVSSLMEAKGVFSS